MTKELVTAVLDLYECIVEGKVNPEAKTQDILQTLLDGNTQKIKQQEAVDRMLQLISQMNDSLRHIKLFYKGPSETSTEGLDKLRSITEKLDTSSKNLGTDSFGSVLTDLVDFLLIEINSEVQEEELGLKAESIEILEEQIKKLKEPLVQAQEKLPEFSEMPSAEESTDLETKFEKKMRLQGKNIQWLEEYIQLLKKANKQLFLKREKQRLTELEEKTAHLEACFTNQKWLPEMPDLLALTSGISEANDEFSLIQPQIDQQQQYIVLLTKKHEQVLLLQNVQKEIESLKPRLSSLVEQVDLLSKGRSLRPESCEIKFTGDLERDLQLTRYKHCQLQEDIQQLETTLEEIKLKQLQEEVAELKKGLVNVPTMRTFEEGTSTFFSIFQSVGSRSEIEKPRTPGEKRRDEMESLKIYKKRLEKAREQQQQQVDKINEQLKNIIRDLENTNAEYSIEEFQSLLILFERIENNWIETRMTRENYDLCLSALNLAYECHINPIIKQDCLALEKAIGLANGNYEAGGFSQDKEAHQLLESIKVKFMEIIKDYREDHYIGPNLSATQWYTSSRVFLDSIEQVKTFKHRIIEFSSEKLTELKQRKSLSQEAIKILKELLNRVIFYLNRNNRGARYQTSRNTAKAALSIITNNGSPIFFQKRAAPPESSTAPPKQARIIRVQ